MKLQIANGKEQNVKTDFVKKEVKILIFFFRQQFFQRRPSFILKGNKVNLFIIFVSMSKTSIQFDWETFQQFIINMGS